MRKFKSNEKVTALALVLALGTAVYLNWEYAKAGAPEISAEPVSAPVSEAIPAGVVTDQLATAVSADVFADKNYGEAQLVSVSDSSSEFFEAARLSRSKTRDEALDTLQKNLKSAKLSDEEKEKLKEELTGEIRSITAENEIESLIKAKGFVDCVSFIDDDRVNITVMTSSDGLTKNEVAQIRDIVLSKCSVTAQNITVVEVK